MENSGSNAFGSSPTIAIIGAGISGLMAAQMLVEHGIGVRLFDKSSGPGGRVATRREGEYIFDHGAQFFTARDFRFKRFVNAWLESGTVAPWTPEIAVLPFGETIPKRDNAPRYVGVPSMNAVGKKLGEGLNVTLNTRIVGAARENGRWNVTPENGPAAGPFDAIVVSTPPAHAIPLVQGSAGMSAAVKGASLSPCWTVLAVFAEKLRVPFDAAFVNDAALQWFAFNSSKPQRPSKFAYVLHAAPDWSIAHLEDDSETVSKNVLDAFFAVSRLRPVAPVFVTAHRWRYALAKDPLPQGCLWDNDVKLGACGDWCYDSRVEGAALSGMTMAEQILRSL